MTLRGLWLRATYPFRQRGLERDLRDEMELHLSLRTERLRDAGWSADAAALEARRRFGNRSRLTSAARDAWGWHSLDGFVQDLRYILRQLRRAPGFAFVTVLTVALGIGINTTAFTLYDAVVLKPLPVSDPASMVRVVHDSTTFYPEELPYPAYETLRRDARTIHAVIATTGPQSLDALLPGRATGDASSVTARFVSPDFFAALGVQPQRGRWFDRDELAVVVDHEFWSSQLAADSTVIGRRLRVGDRDLTIVGITPRGFAGTGVPAIAPNLWIPMSLLPALVPGPDWRYDGRPHWQVLARTAPGSTLDRVRSELASFRAAVPDTAGKPIPLTAKHATFFQSDAGEFDVFQKVSAALMVALGLILAIGVVNLVNLLAARNTAREREVAVRLSLGASRIRIARQLASESLILALTGGALGVVLSAWAASWLRLWIVNTLASVTGGLAGVFLDFSLDARVAAYAFVLSCAIGLWLGLWPAVRLARTEAGSMLRQGVNSTSGFGALRKRNVLLAVQVAASIILLCTAIILLTGLRVARSIEPGFDATHMIVVDVFDGRLTPPERAIVRTDFAKRLAALPQIRAVAWSRRVPFGGTHLQRATSAAGPVTVSIDDVSDTYFAATGIPIVRGRPFTSTEIEQGAPAVVLNATAARLRWPGQDAIGRILPPGDALGGADTTRSHIVVGVAGDVRTNFLSRVNGPSVYFPFGYTGDFGSFLVRTNGPPGSSLLAVRRVAAAAPTGVRTRVMTMTDGPLAVQRLFAEAPAVVALLLALIGVVLASLGVYGLVSHIVARRTREIAIHMALGARQSDVIAFVIRGTLRPVAWGALAGVLGAVGVSTLVRSLVAAPDAPDLTFGAGAFNPAGFVGALTVLGCVVLAACYAPARRAARLDPNVALRVD
jgi:predicted permease